VAYAMTGPPRTVTFSDGTSLPLTGPGFALKRRALPPNPAAKPAG